MDPVFYYECNNEKLELLKKEAKRLVSTLELQTTESNVQLLNKYTGISVFKCSSYCK